MPHARSATRRRWSSTKRRLRRRWPRYAVLLLFFIASLSFAVLVMTGLAASDDTAGVTTFLE